MVNDPNYHRKYIKPLVWFLLIILILVSSSAIVIKRIEGSAQDGTGIKTTQTAKPTTATTTVTPGLTPTISGTPTDIFSDTFMDNSNNWAMTSSPDYTRMMINDQLVLAATDHRILIENVPSTVSFSDFTLNMSYTLQRADQNDSVGLFLRGDTNLDHDYRIDIFGNNTITFNKEYLDENKMPQSTVLLKKSNVAALQTVGRTNTLEVTMDGPVMSLKVNGIQIFSSVPVPDYTQGQIALFVNNGATSDGVIASFSSIEIDSILDPLLFPTVTPSVTPDGKNA
jgi:hypothetical protein